MTAIVPVASDTNSALSKPDGVVTALAQLSAALEGVNDVAEAVRLHTMADTVRHFAARQHYQKEIQNEAARARVQVELKLGELLLNSERNTGARGTGSNQHQQVPLPVDMPPTYEELGISPKQAHQWRALAQWGEHNVSNYVDGCLAFGSDIHFTELYAAAQGKPHVMNNSGNDEWGTPTVVLDAVRLVLPVINLDPASSAAANERVRAEVFYTAQDDGLSKDWGGYVFLNPPYSQPLIGKFIHKLSDSMSDIPAGIVVTNNATETQWGQLLLKHASGVCFPSQRLRFVNHLGKSAGQPLQGQMITLVGNVAQFFFPQFYDAFSKFGVVISA